MLGNTKTGSIALSRASAEGYYESDTQGEVVPGNSSLRRWNGVHFEGLLFGNSFTFIVVLIQFDSVNLFRRRNLDRRWDATCDSPSSIIVLS